MLSARPVRRSPRQRHYPIRESSSRRVPLSVRSHYFAGALRTPHCSPFCTLRPFGMAEPALPGLEDIAPSDLSFVVAFLRDHGFASVRSLFRTLLRACL